MKFAAKVLSISPKFVIPPKQDFELHCDELRRLGF